MATAWIGMGSDRGNRVDWLRRGLRQLRDAGLSLQAVSSLYLTEPVGDDDLPWFVNCVLRVTDAPAPDELLRLCLRVEQRCGRMRRGPGIEARTLDLDVLLYDQRLVELPDLRVPHPRMHLRRFVLRPLAEIDPQYVHPVLGRSLGELLDTLPEGERVWMLAPPPGLD